jgi:hypothetical protein
MVSFIPSEKGVPNDQRVRFFGHEDIDNMAQVLRAVRGRMMGLSWQVIADKEKISKSTLLDRCRTYLGEMGTKYKFGLEGLSDEYHDCWEEKNEEKVALIYTDSQRIRTVSQNEAQILEEEGMDNSMRSLWKETTGISWKSSYSMSESECYDRLMSRPPKKKYKGWGAYVFSILFLRRGDMEILDIVLKDPIDIFCINKVDGRVK